MCRSEVEEDRAVTENTSSEQLATDNTITLESKPAAAEAKTRRLVAKTNPMVAVAVNSNSKPPVASKMSPLRRQNDLDKQFLANSLKVCCHNYMHVTW